MSSSGERPSRSTALRYWFRLGLLNFGGPAAQIALMHEDLVERRRWIGHDRFMHALSYCNLLPGPEAMQLATYIGWLLHGTWGGVVAGTLFVLPGAAAMLGLSVLWALYGGLGWVTGLFYGFGPAVIAIVAAAVLRIGKKSLRHPMLWTTAAGAFVAIFCFDVPFPAIILAAAVLGLLVGRWRPDWVRSEKHGPGALTDETAGPPSGSSPFTSALRAFIVSLILWGAPVAALGILRGWEDLFTRLAVFFSIAAVVTFGGAYAVLSYVAQAAVHRYGWLTAREMAVGLGLDEPTPGPLILIVQWVGFLAGYHHAPAGWSPLAAALTGTLITLWVTFVPCFLWIFTGAPFVERLRGHRLLDGGLAAISAAVVGVILNLALWLALRVLFREVEVRTLGPLTLHIPALRTLDPLAFAAATVGFIGIVRFKWNMIAVVLGGGAIGLVHSLF
jgi:chromate transporter